MADLPMDSVARTALNNILAKSIREMKEYGGMIYLQNKHYRATPPRTSGYGNTVDVGLREPNCGCPPGSKPVASYHTHPLYAVGGVTFDYNNFDDDDKQCVLQWHLQAGYLGTLDGSFFKFDAKSGETIPLNPRLKNN